MFARLLQRWEVSTSSGSHFQVLDGLRGVAILLVVAHHTLYVNPDWGITAKLFNWIVIQAGWMGVPIFFVLSGFLISYPFFQKREQNPQFWYQRGYARRRIGKILPPFYLSIVFFLIFYWVQFHESAYLKSGWLWATGLANFIKTPVSLNGSYWSLIVEAHFYLLLPLLFWLTRRVSVQTTAILIFALLFFVPLIARAITWPAGLFVLPEHTNPLAAQISFNLIRFPCQLDYFAWGVLFAGIYVRLSTDGGRLRGLCLLGYAGIALMVTSLALWGLWTEYYDLKGHPTRWSTEVGHLIPAIAAMLMLFFVFDSKSLGTRIFSTGLLRFIGVISYEWFLFHGPIVQWFQRSTGPAHGSLAVYVWRTIVPIVVTFIFSALVYRYFSLPILKRVRNSLKKP
jgi:peptidoglycan/LPS O-acetylase OafA/YrhL